MIDEEQQTLTEMHLCNSCMSYPCAHIIKQKKEYGEVLVKKCNGYKKSRRKV